MKKNGMKIKSMSAFAGITTFLLMSNLFQINALLNSGIYAFVRRGSIIAAIVFVIINMTFAVKGTYVMRFKFKTATVLMIVYTVSKLYSNHSAGTLDATNLISALNLMLLFMMLDISANKNLLRGAIVGMTAYFVAICALNDIAWVLMRFEPFVYGNNITGDLDLYFIGNKFLVIYNHMICFSLLLMLYRGKNRKFWVTVTSLAAIILSFAFECSTTVVGVIVFFVLMMTDEFFRPFLRNKTVLSGTLLISAAFPFLSRSIMSIGIVQNIVTKFLSRTITLTGRVNIYDNLFRVVSINPLWGIGSGGTTAIFRAAVGGANIQNGLWQIVITYGIIGAVLFIMVLLTGMDASKNFKLNFNSYVVIVMMYVFILMGCVEITYGIQLLLFVAIYNSFFISGKIKEKQFR